jgi:hypothetical protein
VFRCEHNTLEQDSFGPVAHARRLKEEVEAEHVRSDRDAYCCGELCDELAWVIDMNVELFG